MALLTFQPVTLKVFPALLIVIVLSHIPGRVAIQTKGKEKTRPLNGTSKPTFFSELFLDREPFGTYFDVLVSLVDEPLVHLIAETQGVVFDTEVSDYLQLIPGEYLL